MNKNVLKIGALLFIALTFAFGSTWVFNHVNPWLSIIMNFIAGVCVLAAIVQFFKNKKQNKIK